MQVEFFPLDIQFFFIFMSKISIEVKYKMYKVRWNIKIWRYVFDDLYPFIFNNFPTFEKCFTPRTLKSHLTINCPL